MADSVFHRLLRDPLFWLVQRLAILFWLGLYLAGTGLAGSGWLGQHWLLLLQLGLLYPILEEVAFRGLIQGWLWSSRAGRSLASGISLPNLITSLVFTSLHFFYHPPLWALAVFVPSLVFGFFRDRYQHLGPAIYLHIFFNSGYFLLFGN